MFDCIIPVFKLANLFSNLFGCVIPVFKLANQPFRFLNLFIWVMSVLKLVRLYHFGP